jgi:transketolase C-terminal domain/subunit
MSDDMIPRVTVRETTDAEVIRRALHLYLNYRAIEYHKTAARVELDEKLQLSIAYEEDKSFIEGLLRAVEDGTMVAVTDTGSATHSEDGTSDE